MKHKDMDPITMLLIAAGGSLLGNMQSSKATKQADQKLNSMNAQNESWFNNNYYQNYMDSAEVKSAIQTYMDQMKQTNKNIKSSAAITGASPEKAVAVQDRMSQNLSSLLTNLTGRSTQRKDNTMNQYLARKSGIDQMALQNLMQKAQSGQQFSQNAMNIGQSAILGGMTGDKEYGEGVLNKILSALTGKEYSSVAPTFR